MMLIRTRVAPSPIHGMGLFAIEFVPQGTPIWKFQSGFDRTFSHEEFAAMPKEAQDHIRWFAYLSKEDGCYVLSGDHTCFMNHAANPNTGAPANAELPVTTIALRNIVAGEELTCDYLAFDAEGARKLGA